MKTTQKDLDDPAIQEVKARMHGLRDLRMFKRYQSILIALKGPNLCGNRRLLGCAEQTIYNYMRTYRANGLEGLVPGHSHR